jgi:hypothetical protein
MCQETFNLWLVSEGMLVLLWHILAVLCEMFSVTLLMNDG